MLPLLDHQPHGERSTDELVLAHRGLAASIAWRFAGRGEEFDDLLQVASMALVKAASRFDPTRDVRFTTFATATIVGELKRHFRDKRWSMHVPRSLQEHYLVVRDTTELLRQQLQRTPTVVEIAASCGMTVDDVLHAMEVGGALHVDSLESRMAGTDDGPAGDSDIEALVTHTAVAAVVRTLSPLERRVLALRFGEELSQSAIAAETGISQMQVSRVLHRTLQRLRRALTTP
jgi:RNA polymerase sigma-B factor